MCDYADKLEKASIMTMEDGVMDKNLAAMSKLENKTPVDTETFLKENLPAKLRHIITVALLPEAAEAI